ncbi:MAG: hypothetical protein ABW139_20445 [Candidatus Thiodiazotropha sp. DIVDIV]
MFQYSKLLSLMILVFIMNACGGGGGGGGGDTEPVEETTPVNRSLNGFLFSQEPGDIAYLIDVSTGKTILIPNTDWENQNDTFPNGVSQYRKSSIQNNHTAFIVNVLYCKKENPDALARDLSCIYLQDYNGNYLGGLELLYDVTKVQVSEDMQYAALFRNYNSGSTGREWLEIFSIDGTLISDRKMDRRKIQWFRNKSLLLVNGPNFIFTMPLSTDTDYTLTLPENISNGGWINDFDISPDQTQIAFTVATESTAFTSVQAKAYIMDISGNNIRLLADVPNGEAYIASPSWSPDGRWILLEEGHVSGQDRDTIGTAGNLYVVPSENLGKAFMLTMDDSKRSQEVILLHHDHDGPGPGTNLSTNSAGENYDWIP